MIYVTLRIIHRAHYGHYCEMNRQSPGTRIRFRDALFGVYAWIVFGGCILLGLLVALLVPGHGRRYRCLAAIARAIFVLSRVPIDVRGLDNVPEGHSVVVANHASYVDGFLLKGYLPARYSFVIKGEMRNIWFVHFLLRRAGSRFVERFETGGSTRDARKIIMAAKDGESLTFFPEGTFIKEPGVGRFRAVYIVSVIKGAMPVVPIAISGTRAMMPSEQHLPRPVTLRIDILPPIMPDDPAFEDHKVLAEMARQQILDVLDEPDLCAHGTSGSATRGEDQS